MFSVQTLDSRPARAAQLDRKDAVLDAAGDHTRPTRSSNIRGKEMINLELTDNHPDLTDFTLN